MKLKKIPVLFWLYFCLMAVSMAQAQESQQFEGSIGFGAIITRDRSEVRINDLNRPPDKRVSVDPIIYPDMEYDIGRPQGLKLFLNSDPPLKEAGDFALTVGGAYQTSSTTRMKLSAFFSPFEDAWENPYETERERELTAKNVFGAVAGVSNIAGSSLSINCVLAHVDVKEDLIGRKEPDLQRTGELYALKINYSVYPSKNCELRPLLGFKRGIYDGDSNSLLKYKIGLEPRFVFGRLFLLPQIYYSREDYDHMHPIFNQTRQDHLFGVSLKANYKNPFGYTCYSVQALAGYSRNKSNIAFFDDDSIYVGAMLSRHF